VGDDWAEDHPDVELVDDDGASADNDVRAGHGWFGPWLQDRALSTPVG
jgi:hypothetical protein